MGSRKEEAQSHHWEELIFFPGNMGAFELGIEEWKWIHRWEKKKHGRQNRYDVIEQWLANYASRLHPAKCMIHVLRMIFTLLNDWKNWRSIFPDMWKLYGIQISVAIKFYWNTATSILLHVGSRYFCATMAELSNFARGDMACKSQNTYTLTFHRKKFADHWHRSINMRCCLPSGRLAG